MLLCGCTGSSGGVSDERQAAGTIPAPSGGATSTSPTSKPVFSTTAVPAAVPAGWSVIQGDGWTVAMPSPPELDVDNGPGSELVGASTYTVNDAKEGGLTLIVFDYRGSTPAETTEGAVKAMAKTSKATMRPVTATEVGGRPASTALLAGSRNGKPSNDRITAFVAGSKQFTLMSRDTPVHPRVLSTFTG
jgi:hypothetical protein